MVSPLSARLLGLQSVDGSLAVQLQQKIPPPPGVAKGAPSTSSSTISNEEAKSSSGAVFNHGGPQEPADPVQMHTFQHSVFQHVQPASTFVSTFASASVPAVTKSKPNRPPSNTDTKISGAATPTNKPLPSSIKHATSSIRRHIMKSYRPTKPRVRPSGYSADQESNSSSSINSRAGLFILDNDCKSTIAKKTGDDPTKDRRASQIVEHARKRRVEEMNYSALAVKVDLEMAGKSYEYATQLRSRALPVGSIDMSNVRHVTAGTYDEMQQQTHQPTRVVSRRSTSITSLGGVGDTTQMDDAVDLARSSNNVYDALIQDTRQHYNICPKKRRLSTANIACGSSDHPLALLASEGASASQLASRLASVATTRGNRPQQRAERAIDMRSGHSTATPSTSSDTESDASLGALEIAPRLEEGLMSDVTDDYAASSPSPPSVDKAANTITATIETALSYSQKARLVVSSHDPFRIVHANAAYFRLAGLESSSIVGQSLSTVFEEPSEGHDLRAMLSPAVNPGALQNVVIHKSDSVGETENASSASKPKALNCHMSISPVSDSSASRSLARFVSGRVKITHYLLELAESDGSAAPGGNAKNSAAAPKEGFSVIG